MNTGLGIKEVDMNSEYPTPYFPKTKRQMAEEYNMHVSTFRRRLVLAGFHLRGKIMPADQLLIYKKFGAPPCYWLDKYTLVPFIPGAD
jgi:hypothetical protein